MVVEVDKFFVFHREIEGRDRDRGGDDYLVVSIYLLIVVMPRVGSISQEWGIGDWEFLVENGRLLLGH